VSNGADFPVFGQQAAFSFTEILKFRLECPLRGESHH
jgi:hypothetical protein